MSFNGGRPELGALFFIYPDMVELVDSSDLGSDVERRAGSSPAIRTKIYPQGEDSHEQTVGKKYQNV